MVLTGNGELGMFFSLLKSFYSLGADCEGLGFVTPVRVWLMGIS